MLKRLAILQRYIHPFLCSYQITLTEMRYNMRLTLETTPCYRDHKHIMECNTGTATHNMTCNQTIIRNCRIVCKSVCMCSFVVINYITMHVLKRYNIIYCERENRGLFTINISVIRSLSMLYTCSSCIYMSFS